MTDGFSARRAASPNAKADINWGCVGGLILICLLVLGGVGACNAYFGSTRDVTVRVNKTGQTCTSGKSCTNLVYTSGGTFKNSDSLVAGKFNSSDVTGSLCPGGTYTLTVRGWRIPIMSEWPNILKVKAIVSPPPPGSGCTNG